MSTARLSRVLTQWSVGMAVATPLIAIFQGSLLLSDYRMNYSDAPRPITPSSGVIVSLSHQARQARKKKDAPSTTANKPLRLLVVGDSLAAGVGVSGNGLPILPEAIAKALSKALDGRVVCWTCVGTPGISASQIVHDINSIPKREHRRLEKLFQELKSKRDKWTQLQQLKMDRFEHAESGKQQGILPRIIEWWRAEEKEPINVFGKEIVDSGAKWWKRTSGRIRQTYVDVQEAIHAKPSSETEENLAEVDSGEGLHNLVRKGNLFRRDSLDPYVASSFDVAVVLLGLNDLKEAFVPRLMQKADSSVSEDAESKKDALTTQLRSVFFSLEKIMGKMNKTTDHANVALSTEGRENLNNSELLHPPLVVVPELPVAPLEAFRLVPLCWILLPLFRAMERNKKFLSYTFPNHVVFIDQPGLDWWSDAERRHNSYRDEDESFLRLTDIAQTTQTRVKQLMQRFYAGSRDGGLSAPAEESNLPTPPVQTSSIRPKATGTIYIAKDKMHPNDEGYELWGRHIAEEVVRHWSRPKL